MVTSINLKRMIGELNAALLLHGILPEKIILFGSYANGNPHPGSDIDIAIWSGDFTGHRLLDIEKVASVISKFDDLELHPFSLEDTALNNSFVDEIERTGVDYSFKLNA